MNACSTRRSREPAMAQRASAAVTRRVLRGNHFITHRKSHNGGSRHSEWCNPDVVAALNRRVSVGPARGPSVTAWGPSGLQRPAQLSARVQGRIRASKRYPLVGAGSNSSRHALPPCGCTVEFEPPCTTPLRMQGRIPASNRYPLAGAGSNSSRQVN